MKQSVVYFMSFVIANIVKQSGEEKGCSISIARNDGSGGLRTDCRVLLCRPRNDGMLTDCFAPSSLAMMESRLGALYSFTTI